MTRQMRGVLAIGLVLVAVAGGAAFTKRKVDGDAYYNRHLKDAHSKLAERQKLATELGLPMDAAAFEATWGGGRDMWPVITELRRDLTAKGLWAEAANYPSSHFAYSIACQEMPDLEQRLLALADYSSCRSLTDIEKGAMSGQVATSTARGMSRILTAKADREMDRGMWAEAGKSLRLADQIARTAATGPNRDGHLTWAGNLLTLHRKMLMTMGRGEVEPARLEMFRKCLMDETSAPDMLPCINLEYYSRYWAAERFSQLSSSDLREIVVFSPSEDIPAPAHHAASEAMMSSVLHAWTTAVKKAKLNPKNYRRIGVEADYPFITAVLRKSESDYMLVTMDTVFEQIGTMISRALETRALALAAIETISAEKAGKPLPDLSKLTLPQNDYEGRRLVRTKTSDGWVIALEDTKNPTEQTYGLTDRIPFNVLSFRWKSPKAN